MYSISNGHEHDREGRSELIVTILSGLIDRNGKIILCVCKDRDKLIATITWVLKLRAPKVR